MFPKQNQNKTSPDRFLFFAFIALFVWLPLPLGSNRVWSLSLAEIWIILITIAWLSLYMRGRVEPGYVYQKAKPIIFCFVFFVLWAGFQTIPLPFEVVNFLSPGSAQIHALTEGTEQFVSLSVNSATSAATALESLSYFLLFLLTLLLVNTIQRIKMFIVTVIISGLFQSVYGSLMTLSGIEYTFFIPKEASMGAATGTFINRNHLAGYLEMALALGIGLMIANMSRDNSASWRDWFRRLLVTLLSQKARIRLALAIMVIALVLTGSRMGNTAFFVSLAITGVIGMFGLLHLARQGSVSVNAMRPVLILFASLIIIDIFIVGAWFGIDKVKDRIQQTSFASEIRDEVDIYTVDHLNAFWLTGSGGGTFAEVFPQFKSEVFPGFIDHAHNDYLEFASEFGAIGIILLAIVVIWSFANAILAQFTRRSSMMRGIGFSSTMGVLAIMIHSTVDFNLQIPANAALFVVLLAFGWIARFQER